MNIDRPTPSLQPITGTGVAPASKSASHHAPEFSFDTGDAATPNADVQRDSTRTRAAEAGERAPARDRTRGTDRRGDSASRERSRADDVARTKAHDRTNAATRHASTDREEAAASDGAATTDIAATSATSAGDATTTVANDDTPATTSTDSLPDRMLALLTGDWAAAAPESAAPDSATASGTTTLPIGATLQMPAAAPGTTPSLATVAALATTTDTTGAAAPNAVPANTPGAGAPVGVPVGVPVALMDATTAAQPASNTPATDAFAALAALAETRTDRGARSASTDTSSTIATAAFNPMLAKGADAPLAAVRDVAVAMPAAAPLALDADFDDGLTQRITWMADQRLDRAEIRVTPDALGPIDIRLQMDGYRVNAQFHAAHADVRQALESGMDRLRDLLGRQGMELGQAQVGHGGRDTGDGRPAAGSGHVMGDSGRGDDAQPQVTTIRTLRSRGLIDEYA